jgi:hypothetical protein
MHSREAVPPRGEGLGGGFLLLPPGVVCVSLPLGSELCGLALRTGALYALRSLRSTITGSDDA